MTASKFQNKKQNSGKFPADSMPPPLSSEDMLSLPIEQLMGRLNASPQGFSSEEAEKRLELYGPNEFARKKKRAAIFNFLSRFKSPLVIILIIAGGVSAALGSIPSVIVIYTMVFLSVSLAYYQENNASKAAELLREKVATLATVLRDNTKQEIKLPLIVPGDIILLSAGDITPADARIVEAKDLFVNQSALTGESFPVEKTSAPVKNSDASITEWTNYLFMGTSIVSGSASAIVVRTGGSTEYGKIAEKLVEKAPETEFERGTKQFGFLIMQVTLLLVIFVFMINALLHPNAQGILEALLFAVALAVGLTPELLPMIITINLSKGAQRMSKKGVIVKRLSAIETFGSMNVLCTDKTGTLTENQIELLLHINIDGKEDEKVLLYSFLNSRFQTGLKSPLDEAILKHQEIDISTFKKIDEVPFDFVRRRVSVVVEQEKERFFIAKGAPEEILKVCSYYEDSEGLINDISEEIRKKVEQKYFDLSAEGLRVLGVACKKLREDKAVYSINDECDMTFLGFVAFLDPPKKTAKQSLEMLSKANVELKILTGDNELVTRKVCSELGFEVKGVVLGNEIALMTNEALAAVVEDANVFARVTPAQKDRIISVLKTNGHVVGFMGDGINDAPSIKTSDVGISVSNAVDVARESADIILLKNDLTVLGEGVLEGRKTFGNTMKYIMMGVSSNFGNMFSAAGGSIFLAFLPMLPIQILLNNLLYDTSQTVMTTDNVDSEYIIRPKRWDISFIRKFMVTIGPVSSLFDFATFFTMIFIFGIPYGLSATGAPLATSFQQGQFQTAWFTESLCSQTLVVLIIRTRKVPFYKSKPSKYLVAMLLAVISFAIIVPYTPVGAFFGFVPPPPAFYLALAGILGVYAVLAEVVKKWFYKRNANLLEQVRVVKVKTVFSDRSVRFMQDMIAVISLLPDDEFSIESFTDDLKSAINYPINQNQLARNLQYLRRSGLITVDWSKRTIKREKTLKDYVKKDIITGPMWATIGEDWRKINAVILHKRGKVNPEYQELLTQQ